MVRLCRAPWPSVAGAGTQAAAAGGRAGKEQDGPVSSRVGGNMQPRAHHCMHPCMHATCGAQPPTCARRVQPQRLLIIIMLVVPWW